MKKIILLIALLFSFPALAATTANSVITPQTPNRGIVQFLQGTDAAGTYKTLYTAGSNGSIIKAIFATSNDASAAHLVTCQVVNSAVKYGGTSVNVPINAGFANATAQINMMSSANWVGLPMDSDGNPFLFMISGDTLQCTFATALTSTDVLNLVAVASDF